MPCFFLSGPSIHFHVKFDRKAHRRYFQAWERRRPYNEWYLDTPIPISDSPVTPRGAFVLSFPWCSPRLWQMMHILENPSFVNPTTSPFPDFQVPRILWRQPLWLNPPVTAQIHGRATSPWASSSDGKVQSDTSMQRHSRRCRATLDQTQRLRWAKGTGS